MGSCITSLLKPSDIHFPINVSWRSHEEVDSYIQHRHLASQLLALVEPYAYNWTALESNDLDAFAGDIAKFRETSIPQLLRVKCAYDDTTARPPAITDSKNIFALARFLPLHSPTTKDC